MTSFPKRLSIATGDGDIDNHDKRLYLQLADAFVQFKGLKSTR